MDLCFLGLLNQDELLEFQMDIKMINIFLKALLTPDHEYRKHKRLGNGPFFKSNLRAYLHSNILAIRKREM